MAFENTLQAERIHYLDLLKFIAIVSVCLAHFSLYHPSWAGPIVFSDNINFMTMVRLFIYGMNSVDMPLIFMVSGALALTKEPNIKRTYKKQAVFLLQYYFWRFVTIVTLASFNGVDLLSHWKAYLLNNLFFLEPIKGLDITHFWFLPVFISLSIISPFFVMAFNKPNYKQMILPVLIVLFVLYFSLYEIDALKILIPNCEKINVGNLNQLKPFQQNVGFGLFYFLSGAMLSKDLDKYKRISVCKLLIAFLTGAILLFIMWYKISEFSNVWWDNVYRGKFTTPAALMSFSVFVGAAKIPKAFYTKSINRVLGLVGSNTLNVYYLHWIFGYTVLEYFKACLLPFSGSLVLNLCKAILMVLAFSLLAERVKRVPFLNKVFH